jgi:hypothetical protein
MARGKVCSKLLSFLDKWGNTICNVCLLLLRLSLRLFKGAMGKLDSAMLWLLDTLSGWLYDRINNWCKRHKISLDPSISRWSIFTVFLSTAFFGLSLCSTFLTLYITRPGGAWMLALAIIMGGGGVLIIIVALLFAYACVQRGSSDPHENIQKQMGKTQQQMAKSLKALVRTHKELVQEIKRNKKDRESRHGTQSTIESEDV